MTDEKSSAWNEDYLDRKKEAEYIKKYLNNIYQENLINKDKNSFVLNLNAPWGFGKSYFLENFKIDLENEPHPVIYFDAWKNDYSKNPILGFISEIGETLKIYKKEIPKGDELAENFFKQGKKIIGALTGVGINVLAKKITGYGIESLKEQFNDDEGDEVENLIGERSEKLINEIVQRSLDEHQDLKRLIEDFKINLEKITKSLSENAGYSLPMYILIDELDRCRPTFAIELLENIKHIFNADGIFFIIATNKEELAHSIQAVYGDSFDSFNYLRRFFNQEYTISLSSREKFTSHLFERYRISAENLAIPFDKVLNKTEKIEQLIFEKAAKSFNLSLRDMEQICVQLKSILLTAHYQKLHYIYLIFILMTRFKNKDRNEIDHSSYTNFELIALMPVDNFNYRPTPIKIVEVVQFYISLSMQTRKDFSDRLNRSPKGYEEIILHDLISEQAPANNLSSLASYILLAKQAGHIS